MCVFTSRAWTPQCTVVTSPERKSDAVRPEPWSAYVDGNDHIVVRQQRGAKLPVDGGGRASLQLE
jgi:hypothetical protein